MKRGILLILALILLSCSDLHKKGQLSEIKELDNRIQTIEEEFQVVNLEQLEFFNEQLDLIIEKVEAHGADTVSLNTAYLLDEFAQCSLMLEPINDQCVSLNEALDNQKMVLQNLRTDIESGSGQRQYYDDYIAKETMKLDTLSAVIKSMASSFKNCETLFNEKQDSLLSLLK